MFKETINMNVSIIPNNTNDVYLNIDFVNLVFQVNALFTGNPIKWTAC